MGGCCASSSSNYTKINGTGDYYINLEIIEAKGLLNSDTCGGKSDPYCKVFRLGEFGWTNVYKTKTINNSNNPVWNQSVSFPGMGECQAFEVRVYDSDKLSDDDPIGSVSVFMNKFAKTADSGPEEKWFKVKGSNLDGEVKSEAAKGELRLKIQKDTKTKISPMKAATGNKDEYKINLKIVKAKDLLNSDGAGMAVGAVAGGLVGGVAGGVAGGLVGGAVGKSDPYCKVFVLGENGWTEVYKTKTINNSNNPVWDEVISFAGQCYCQIFEVRVYDSDTQSDDDPIGTVDVSMDKFAKTADSENPAEQWFTVKGSNLDGDVKSEHAKGELFLMIKKEKTPAAKSEGA